jgi:citronellol/citronellal dehydrogenase
MGALEGRVALVTGASRGIGAAIAQRFAAEGAQVAVTARTVDPTDQRLPGTIGETVDLITTAGGRAAAFRADLARPEERTRLVEEVGSAFGRIDVLVNNAAVTYFTPVREFTARRFALMFEVQVTAPTHLAQLVVPGMVERGGGWILNVSSGAARHPGLPPPTVRGGTL